MVLVPRPVGVMIRSRSKACRLFRVVVISRKNVVGDSSGIEMLKKRRTAPAPSSWAACMTSCESDCSPPRYTIAQ